MRAKILRHPATETEIIYVATLADGSELDSDELCNACEFNCASFHADHFAQLLHGENVIHIRGVSVPSWRAIRYSNGG